MILVNRHEQLEPPQPVVGDHQVALQLESLAEAAPAFDLDAAVDGTFGVAADRRADVREATEIDDLIAEIHFIKRRPKGDVLGGVAEAGLVIGQLLFFGDRVAQPARLLVDAVERRRIPGVGRIVEILHARFPPSARCRCKGEPVIAEAIGRAEPRRPPGVVDVVAVSSDEIALQLP